MATGTVTHSQQPADPFCGTCSTEHCPHGVCRVCGSCGECDWQSAVDAGRSGAVQAAPLSPAAAPAIPFEEVRLSAWRVSRRIEDLAVRADYLYGAGIAWKEMQEASQAIDSLLGDLCICGNRKMPRDSLCGECFHALPCELRPRMKLHISRGYLHYLRQAHTFLAQRRLQRATAEHGYAEKKQAVP